MGAIMQEVHDDVNAAVRRLLGEGYKLVSGNTVEMSPQQFLDLAVPFGHQGGPLADRDKVARLAQLDRWDANPMLSVKERPDGRLQVGLHDGRHRALAALAQGRDTLRVDIVRARKYAREHPEVSDAALARRAADEGLIGELGEAVAGDSSPEVQDAIDAWISAALESPELDEYLRAAPVLTRRLVTYRALFGPRAVYGWERHQVGDWIDFPSMQSTAMSWQALQQGVIEPNGGEDEYIILKFILTPGASYGRQLSHSNPEHPENAQDEFLLKPGLRFRLTAITPPRAGCPTEVYTLER